MRTAARIADIDTGVRSGPMDVDVIRREFPILGNTVHGKPLVYLDSAATTQKPEPVMDAIRHHYSNHCANVHRGVHLLSQLATEEYEGARERVRRFVNARESREIVFVRGATEAINLVARSFARSRLGEGDEILITGMEHHSNIVPWQMLRDETGAILRVVPIDENGRIDIAEYGAMLSPRTRLVAVTHISNALGTVNPVRRMIEVAHRRGIPVLLDGAQAVGHRVVDVRDLDCDFYAFSGHKMYGPTGIGALYARAEILEEMTPFQGGGDMIASVTFEKTTYNRIPHRFEAGTPDIAGAVGLAAAIDYLESLGLDAVREHETGVMERAVQSLEAMPGVRLVGRPEERSSVVSFLVEGVHPHDAGTILDLQGVAVRAGHHCAQPVMDRFGIPATLRASLGVYNSYDDVDSLMDGIRKVREVFG